MAKIAFNTLGNTNETDKLEAAIEDIGNRSKTLREDIQHVLMGVLSHWKLTKSNQHVKRLVGLLDTAMGDGMKRNGMKSWVIKHLGMIENAETGDLVCGTLDHSELDKTKADAQKWWSMAPEGPVKFDLDAAIVSLLKKADKAQEKLTKGELKEGDSVDVDVETLAALKALAATRQISLQ
jgi:hypothetical protein